MRGADLQVGEVYMAYVGSLAPVVVEQVGVAIPNSGTSRRDGIIVRAMREVRYEVNRNVVARRAGDQFVVRNRYVVRLATAEERAEA